jgi:CO/xanthine dehydrogenase Mo-binding subunit
MSELPAALERYPDLDRWVRVEADGAVTVFTGKVELGQGITTALALIAAQELGVPVSRIRVQTAHTVITPDERITAGSTSVESSGAALRQACAHARHCILESAGSRLGLSAAELDIFDGRVTGPGLNQGPDIAELVGGRPFAHRVQHLRAERPPAVPPARQPRLDLPAKIRGEAAFLQDLRWPDMLHAQVVRPPTYRHRLANLDAPQPPGDSDLRLIWDGSFLAVMGSDEYQVVRFAQRVEGCCRWRQLAELSGEPLGQRALSYPLDGGEPVERPEREIDFEPDFTATYTRPHVMHASLAPSAAAALWRDHRLTVWSHSQGVELLKHTLAEALDLDAAQVTVIHVQGAGAYGHNGADDAALDAALCALAEPGRPVLLKWTRVQEHRWEPYGPAMRIDLAAGLDDAGRVVHWRHEVWSYTHAGRPLPGQQGSNLAAAWLRAEPRPAPEPQPRLSAEVGIHRNAWPI